jgi:choline dehydrogenase-like flavoprotein
VSPTYDAIVIGSGFGGAMAAWRLVHAGWRVLMLERGPWVPRGLETRHPDATLQLTPVYTQEPAYRVLAGGYANDGAAVLCVGGPSVYYGGVSFRLREDDFAPGAEIVGASQARWPFRYADLEPFYVEAERILHVSGDDADDPTRPHRSAPFPQPPPPVAAVSERFRAAARDLHLHPFPLPLAIDFQGRDERSACDACRFCDTYACAIEAKNDLAVAVLRPLVRRGLDLRAMMAVTRLVEEGGRITEVTAWDKTRNEHVSFRGRHVIVAAGALASPHLLLASDLDKANPAGDAVGRYLTRHCAAMVIGFCNFRPDPARVFHKHFAVLDYYFGDPGSRRCRSQRIGSIQQITTPPAALMKAFMPRFWDPVPMGGFMEHLTGALVIAEDEPQASNRVTIDRGRVDAFGLPQPVVTHRYTAADERRRRRLIRRAKRILRRVGAWSFYTHPLKTFSHALGTVRMGVDAASSPLDERCRFRGISNLLVVDGSALPTSGAVNPSLTIAANALRAAAHLVDGASR